jgi:hypothetical protein
VEQSLLYLLAANAGRVVTREEILDTLWGVDYAAETDGDQGGGVGRHSRQRSVALGKGDHGSIARPDATQLMGLLSGVLPRPIGLVPQHVVAADVNDSIDRCIDVRDIVS